MLLACKSAMLIIDDIVEIFRAKSQEQACGDFLTWNL